MPKYVEGSKVLKIETHTSNKPVNDIEEGTTASGRVVTKQPVKNKVPGGTESDILDQMSPADVSVLTTTTTTRYEPVQEIEETYETGDFVIVDEANDFAREAVLVNTTDITDDDRLKGFLDAEDKKDTFKKAYDDLIKARYSDEEAKIYASKIEDFPIKDAFQMYISDLCDKKK
jgi:hypothetical protein